MNGKTAYEKAAPLRIRTAVKKIIRGIINIVYNRIYRKRGYNQTSNFTEYDRYPGIFAYVNYLMGGGGTVKNCLTDVHTVLNVYR
jgi:hypothetical protein